MKACTKLLSILLVVAMCFSFMAVTAFAEEGEEAPQSATPVVDGIVIAAGEPGTSASASSDSGIAKIKISEEETQYFATVEDALESAQEGQLVVLLGDVKLTKAITIPENVTLSLNGKTLTFVPGVSEDAAIVMGNGSALRSGEIRVLTTVTKDAVFTFASVITGEGAVNLKNLWLSNEGGRLLSGSAAAFSLEAQEGLDGVYKVVEPVVEESAAAAEPVEGELPVEEPAVEEPAVEPSEEPAAGEPAAEPSEEPAAGEAAAEPSEEPSSEEPAEEPVEEPVAEEPTEEPVEEPAEEPVEEPAEEPIEAPAEEPAEAPAEEPVEEPAEEPVEEPAEEPVEEPAGEDEINAEQKPDVVADEPSDTRIQNDTAAYESISACFAKSKDGYYWLTAHCSWDVADWGSTSRFGIDMCTYSITGPIVVPAGKTLLLSHGVVKGDITVNGTLELKGVSVEGNIYLSSTGTQAIVNASEGTTAGTVAVDGSFGEVSPNISDGKYNAITFTGPASNVVGGVTGGLFKAAVPVAVCAKGTYPAASKDDTYKYTVGKYIASVKNDSGKKSTDYYKGSAQASKNYNLSFTVSPGLTALSVKNAASKATVATLTQGTDYNYYAAGGKVEISKYASFLETLPADALVLAFDVDGGGYVEFPLNVWANVTFTPSRYYKGSGTNIIFDVTDIPLDIIMDTTDTDAGTTLKAGSDYTISGNKITMPAAFLESLDGGSHNFFFKYALGSQTYRLRCTVAVLVDYRVFKINDVSVSNANSATVDWYTNSGKTLTFYADGDYAKFTGVKIGDKTLNAGSYSYRQGENGTIVSINPGYLNTLAKGNYPVTLMFKDGEATAQFDVHYGSASPKTGDENNLILWAAVMLLSGSAVVALIPKKKKQ